MRIFKIFFTYDITYKLRMQRNMNTFPPKNTKYNNSLYGIIELEQKISIHLFI